MIKTRKDLSFYLEKDRQRNNISSFWGVIIGLFTRNEHVCVYRYLICLRHCEYHMNNSTNLLHKVLYFFYKAELSRLGGKYNIRIKPNTCGYGLRIPHLAGGGGVLLNIEKAGNYCGFQSGVLLGNKDNQLDRPIIGSNVAFGPGAKCFGRIKIGDNVFVAANAVVTHDVPDNCIVGGIPAHIIKRLE